MSVYDEILKQLQSIQDKLSLQDELFDLDKCCAFTGLSKSALYKKTANREIPHFQTGRKLYFRKSEIVLWLTQFRVKTATEINEEVMSASCKIGKY
jgi:excisionase family DNA binding protein